MRFYHYYSSIATEYGIGFYQDQRYATALPCFHFSLAFVTCLDADDLTPPTITVPELYMYITKTYVQLTKYDEALRYTTIAINTDGADHSVPPEFLQVGATVYSEAVELYNQGRFIEALPAFKIVLVVYNYFTIRPPYSAATEVPMIKTYIARTLRGIEQYELALQYCREAIIDYSYIGYDINDRIVIDLTDLANDIFDRLHNVRPVNFAPSA